ncbi:MAG TPA: cytochrome c biogenesis protein ResB [Microbacteriaceae bacterium]|nr:cytochrome c biogenesis protein ResB [Microbacteriaceae bacterium]
MSLPSDHIDSTRPAPRLPAGQVTLGFRGWVRWFWRQLTSMHTAIFLLLLLAVAALPGSLIPQREADPNGVVQYQAAHPALTPILEKLQFFDVYTSVWFSAIYILLFISLIGCIIPRVKHHIDALRARPPRTPARLDRMPGYRTESIPAASLRGSQGAGDAIESATEVLRHAGYRTQFYADKHSISVSGERGYLRETGNLVFHIAIMAVLVAVGVGGGYGYSGEKIVMQGQTFVNTLVSYDSFNPGRFFTGERLSPYSLTLKDLAVRYETKNKAAIGQPLDYTAYVTARKPDGSQKADTVKVNTPLYIGGTNVYLLGNGYAPVITVRDPAGHVRYRQPVPFLPQDNNYTSIGVVKIADGLPAQVGIIGSFYPTAGASGGVPVSTFPGLRDPVLSLDVFKGDLGINDGVPRSVYTLDTNAMTQVSGPGVQQPAEQLRVGQTVKLPDGLGSVTFDGVKRYVSFTISHNPAQLWIFICSVFLVGGLLTALLVPRRRMWVKARQQRDGSVLLEYAGLARGDDPGLLAAVESITAAHRTALSGPAGPEPPAGPGGTRPAQPAPAPEVVGEES